MASLDASFFGPPPDLVVNSSVKFEGSIWASKTCVPVRASNTFTSVFSTICVYNDSWLHPLGYIAGIILLELLIRTCCSFVYGVDLRHTRRELLDHPVVDTKSLLSLSEC